MTLTTLKQGYRRMPTSALLAAEEDERERNNIRRLTAVQGVLTERHLAREFGQDAANISLDVLTATAEDVRTWLPRAESTIHLAESTGDFDLWEFCSGYLASLRAFLADHTPDI